MNALSTWLRTTIPGTIVLGALGSAVVVVLQRALVALLRRFKVIRSRSRSDSLREVEYLKTLSDREMVVHSAYHLAQLIMISVTALMSFVGEMTCVILSNQPEAKGPFVFLVSVLFTALGCVSVYSASRNLRTIRRVVQSTFEPSPSEPEPPPVGAARMTGS
jgi:hypothetical protein